METANPKVTVQGIHRLRKVGLTDVAQIVALGGRPSRSGANFTFIQGDPGFERVVALCGVKFPDTPATTFDAKEWLRENGPRLWDEWHRGIWFIEPTSAAWDAYAKRTIVDPLPSTGCTCRTHIVGLLAALRPPEWTPRMMVDTSYLIHDEVSRALWKIPIGVARARRIYEPIQNGAPVL